MDRGFPFSSSTFRLQKITHRVFEMQNRSPLSDPDRNSLYRTVMIFQMNLSPDRRERLSHFRASEAWKKQASTSEEQTILIYKRSLCRIRWKRVLCRMAFRNSTLVPDHTCHRSGHLRSRSGDVLPHTEVHSVLP